LNLLAGEKLRNTFEGDVDIGWDFGKVDRVPAPSARGIWAPYTGLMVPPPKKLRLRATPSMGASPIHAGFAFQEIEISFEVHIPSEDLYGKRQ